MYAMLAGGIAPIPFWLWQRRFPDTRLKYINLPVMLNGPTLAPPANGINYVSWFIVGFIFRTSLSLYLCMPTLFDFVIIICLVLFVVGSGWAGMMSAWRDAELSGRSLKSGGLNFDRVLERRSTPPLPRPRGRSLSKLLGGFTPTNLPHRRTGRRQGFLAYTNRGYALQWFTVHSPRCYIGVPPLVGTLCLAVSQQ